MRGRPAIFDQLAAAPDGAPVSVGDAVAFVPSAFTDFAPTTAREVLAKLEAAYTLNGRVIYVNAPHRFYRVEADCFGYAIRESFKF